MKGHARVVKIKAKRPETHDVVVSVPTLKDGVWSFAVECDATMVLHPLLAPSVANGIVAIQKRLRDGAKVIKSR